MSFNRGMNTNSFINRGNLNRRIADSKMNKISNIPFGNTSIIGGSRMDGINPWGNGMSGRGILPSNNNLSLSSSQAQLVAASTLLTNLLRNQQGVQSQIPSLLSLETNFSGPGPNFSNQQNFTSGRYNDRPARHSMKNQRFQPYNKMVTKARNDPVGRRSHPKQQSRALKSGSQHMNGNQTERRIDKSSKSVPAFKKIQTVRKEQQDIKTSDNEKVESSVLESEQANTSENNIRQCKDEKSTEGTEAKEEKDAEDPDKKAEQSIIIENRAQDANASIEKHMKRTGKKSGTRHAESRYAEVPMSCLRCHICNKHMWDGLSFDNHLRGFTHQLMMKKLDESYKLKADIMRHELRVAEEQRELSLNKSKRLGKNISVDFNVREYCIMCDLNFYGTLSTHRKNEKHRQLKTFLHPRCFPCLKEFPSRIEYDEHCLTPTHMKNVVHCEEERKTKIAKGEAEVCSAENEEKDVCHESNNEKEEDLTEQEYVLDIIENLNEQKLKIPSYKYCHQNKICIGKSMVREVQGFYCERCRRFMLRAEDVNAHLRSPCHYKYFVAEIKSLISNTGTIEAKEDKQMKNKTDISENIEEYEKNETEDIDKVKPSIKDMNVQEVTNEKEKHDPVEVDINSEEDESYQQEDTLNKDALIDEMDIDNEKYKTDNIINDTNEKEFVNHEKSTQNMGQNHNSQIAESSKYRRISQCELYTRRPRL